MPRPTTFFVFLTASALVLSVHSLRESDDDSDHDVRISVSPRSFHMAGVAPLKPEGIGALTQLHDEHTAKPEEDKDQAAALFSLDLDRGSDSSAVHAEALEKPAGAGSASESGSEKAKEQAKAQLEEVALERQRVTAEADRLDREMNAQLSEIVGAEAADNHRVGSLMSVSETESTAEASPKMSEDEQFGALEKQTDNIMKWFGQLKSLRNERDKLKAKKDAAVQGASNVGISSEDIAKKLLATSPDASTSKSKSDGKAKGSGLLEKREKLASVMASSAIEMAQLQSAASDVMTGLDAYAVWKKRTDDGAESQAEAARVKAQLDSAVKFLAEHEDTIGHHTEQIDAMMREAGNGQQ